MGQIVDSWWRQIRRWVSLVDNGTDLELEAVSERLRLVSSLQSR